MFSLDKNTPKLIIVLSSIIQPLYRDIFIANSYSSLSIHKFSGKMLSISISRTHNVLSLNEYQFFRCSSFECSKFLKKLSQKQHAMKCEVNQSMKSCKAIP